MNIWITQQFLKEKTPLGKNIDINELANHLESVQLVYTRELLGKNLFDYIDTNLNNLNEIETELYNMCKYAIAYRTSEVALPFLQIKLRPKGAMTSRDEYSEGVDLDQLKYIRHELKNKAEYWEDLILKFLSLNGSEFPLWLSNANNSIITANTDQKYDSDIYLDDDNFYDRNKRYYYGPNSNEPGNNY